MIANGLSNFRPDVSQTAHTQYRTDYERDYQGRSILLGPHLARGISPDNAIRIYWWIDHDARQFVIGHVGDKLRDAGNP